jgi:transglutaminase-like putative cysteine protease
MSAIPRTPPEESLWLRVLVQGMVIVGVVATDVAADTQMSLWAIPLSLIGATWSWYRRRHRNIGMKFALAFAMLGALGYFLANIAANLNDTRLTLAKLLVQMLVIHTFDLPRRKDLGYSMTIGLILIGVAGTLSQTLTFAPLLLLFLAIAVPVLFLDYRSRLNLPPLQPIAPKSKSDLTTNSQFPWKRLGQIFGLVVALGLIAFALMPRFAGYQTRALPMSSPIEYRGKFDGKGINNPGYQKQGQGKGGGSSAPLIDGNGGGGEQSQTQLDEEFYYGFNTQINQNLRGIMKPKLVMRVRSQSPGFWRALAFDRYTGKGWEISQNDKTQKIQRSIWSYKFSIAHPLKKNKTKEVIQSYTAVAELPNIIPALADATEVYFPTNELAIDREGSLRSPVGLTPGLTYTVVSQVPYRDRSRLDGATSNYPREIRDAYLQIPPEIAPKLQKYTQDLVDRYAQEQVGKTTERPKSNYAIALYLAQYLKQHYNLPQDPLGLERVPEGKDLVQWFLFRCEGKSTSCDAGGYPDHFVTTYTMMLRSIGIPARMAVGFASGKFNPFTGMYEVYNTDAHALTEVYFPKYGWFAFDPIPGHDLFPPTVEEDRTFSTLEHIWNFVAGWLPSPVTAWLAAIWGLTIGALLGAIAWFFNLFSQGWLGLFTAIAIAIIIGFLGWLGWQQWRRWKQQRWLQSLPAIERIYQQMLALLGKTGTVKYPAQTPLEYAHIAQTQQPHAIGSIIAEISHAYTAWRYGDRPQNLQHLQGLLADLQRGLANRQRLG